MLVLFYFYPFWFETSVNTKGLCWALIITASDNLYSFDFIPYFQLLAYQWAMWNTDWPMTDTSMWGRRCCSNWPASYHLKPTCSCSEVTESCLTLLRWMSSSVVWSACVMQNMIHLHSHVSQQDISDKSEKWIIMIRVNLVNVSRLNPENTWTANWEQIASMYSWKLPSHSQHHKVTYWVKACSVLPVVSQNDH